MCGKFAAGHLTQAQMLDIMEGFLKAPWRIDTEAPSITSGFQICPSEQISVAYLSDSEGIISSCRWNTGPSMNARIENDSYWQQSWNNGRCVIPAVGYFESSEIIEFSGQRWPHFITVERNAPVMFFAGLLSPDGKSCAIMTRDASPQIAKIHDRMPVICSDTDIEPWLTYDMDIRSAQAELGASWEGRFNWHTVKAIKRGRRGPDVIEPFDPPVQTSFMDRFI